MRSFEITAADANSRLDRFVSKRFPGMSAGFLQKAIRTRRVLLNGKKTEGNARVQAGDVVDVCLSDEDMAGFAKKKNPFYENLRVDLRVIYEDNDILLVDKRPGVIVHADESEKVDTLVQHVRAYLYQKGRWNPADAFAPAPCNRIDRFTGGIVIFAKNQAAAALVGKKLRAGQIDKIYLAIVRNANMPAEGMLVGYIQKHDEKSRVDVFDTPRKGAQEAKTCYRVLAKKGEIALVECRLFTGRTHQIRAQMAHAGHPLLGDNQYGDDRFNRKYDMGRQALCSAGLRFKAGGEEDGLSRLNDRSFFVTDVPFARRFFPDFDLKSVR